MSQQSTPNDADRRRDEARRWSGASGSSTRWLASTCRSASCGSRSTCETTRAARFYWPMLGTGLGVLVTGVVLGGIGGVFGTDWERRQMEQYLHRSGDGTNGDGTVGP